MKKRIFILIGVIICIVSLIGLAMGCSAGDPLEDDVYFRNLYVWDPVAVAWTQVTGSGVEADPIFTGSPAFLIALADINAWNNHPALTTGVHGVGAGDVVGTTLVQNLTNKTLTASRASGVWTTLGVWTLPAMTFGGDVTTDRWLNSTTNTFFGVDVAGSDNLAHTGGSEGWYNTGIGSWALYNITTGHFNTGIGDMSLSAITSGFGNSALGEGSLIALQDGVFNTGVGNDALASLVSGDRNTAVGLFAGHECLGDDNVFIGAEAGYYEAGSDTLYIDNSDTATPLIYGNFSTDILTIFGDFVVSGNVNFSGLTAYADNDAAVAGGLAVGDLYRTGGNPDLVCVVH